MNELYFLLQIIICMTFMLLAHRLGKLWLMGIIAACAVLMNIYVLKSMDLFGLSVTGGNVLYACIFFGSDILAEHYGPTDAKRAVRIGFFVSVFFLITSQIIFAYIPNQFDFVQKSYQVLFTITPRIVMASMITYLITQHLDIMLFLKIRQKTNGRFLWLRNNGSTWISQLLDTILFTYMAFYGIFPNLFDIILFTYVIKILIALVDTPFIYVSHVQYFLPKELRIKEVPHDA